MFLWGGFRDSLRVFRGGKGDFYVHRASVKDVLHRLSFIYFHGLCRCTYVGAVSTRELYGIYAVRSWRDIRRYILRRLVMSSCLFVDCCLTGAQSMNTAVPVFLE